MSDDFGKELLMLGVQWGESISWYVVKWHALSARVRVVRISSLRDRHYALCSSR